MRRYRFTVLCISARSWVRKTPYSCSSRSILLRGVGAGVWIACASRKCWSNAIMVASPDRLETRFQHLDCVRLSQMLEQRNHGGFAGPFGNSLPTSLQEAINVPFLQEFQSDVPSF